MVIGDDDPNPRALTGRKVLALLEQLPDESRYKTQCEREGDWPELMYLLAGAANEQKMSRVDQAAYHGQGMQVELFESPRQREDREDGRKLSRAAHDHLVAQMSGKAGPRAPRNRTVTRETDIDQRRAAAEQKRKQAARRG